MRKTAGKIPIYAEKGLNDAKAFVSAEDDDEVKTIDAMTNRTN